MRIRHKSLPALLCALLFAGCSGEQAIYNRESFASDSPFRLDVDAPGATACDGARRALLGQGYLIEKSDAEQVKGRKAYRSEGDQNTFIEVNVVCVGEEVGSTIFANGVLSTYDLKKSSSPASVGVSAIGSISLPIGRSAESLVKIGEETIDDPAFYQRFFGAVKGALQSMRARSKPAEPSAAPAGEKPPTTGAAPASPAIAPPPATEPLAPPATPGGLLVETRSAVPTGSPPTGQPATPAPAQDGAHPASEPGTAEPGPGPAPEPEPEPEPEPLF